MSKEADLVQVYNDEKREYEYFVKGFDVTESIRILLKAHKEAYDKERRVFTECKAYCDAEKEFKDKISDLEAKLGDMEQEQIKEMQEHQEAMKLADKTIKDLEIKLLLKPSFGKFKSADELYKSYTNLGKEYTKSRQQLAEKDLKIIELETKLNLKDKGTNV